MAHVDAWSEYTAKLQEKRQAEETAAARLGVTQGTYLHRCSTFNKAHKDLVKMCEDDDTGILPPGVLALFLAAMRDTWCRTGDPEDASGSRGRGTSTMESQDPGYFAKLPPKLFENASRSWNFTNVTGLSTADAKARKAWKELEDKGLELGHFQDAPGTPSWEKLDDEAKIWGCRYAGTHPDLMMSPRDFERKRVRLHCNLRLTLCQPLVNII